MGSGRPQHIPLGQDPGEPGSLQGRRPSPHPGLDHHGGDLGLALGRGGEDLGRHDVAKLWATVPPCACRILRSAAAADLISVGMMRETAGSMSSSFSSRHEARPRADARPPPPEDLHARLVQLAVGVVGAYGIGNRLQPGDRVQEAVRDVVHWRLSSSCGLCGKRERPAPALSVWQVAPQCDRRRLPSRRRGYRPVAGGGWPGLERWRPTTLGARRSASALTAASEAATVCSQRRATSSHQRCPRSHRSAPISPS